MTETSKVSYMIYESVHNKVATATWRNRITLGVNNVETPVWLTLEQSLHNEITDNFWRNYIDGIPF